MRHDRGNAELEGVVPSAAASPRTPTGRSTDACIGCWRCINSVIANSARSSFASRDRGGSLASALARRIGTASRPSAIPISTRSMRASPFRRWRACCSSSSKRTASIAACWPHIPGVRGDHERETATESSRRQPLLFVADLARHAGGALALHARRVRDGLLIGIDATGRHRSRYLTIAATVQHGPRRVYATVDAASTIYACWKPSRLDSRRVDIGSGRRGTRSAASRDAWRTAYRMAAAREPPRRLDRGTRRSRRDDRDRARAMPKRACRSRRRTSARN